MTLIKKIIPLVLVFFLLCYIPHSQGADPATDPPATGEPSTGDSSTPASDPADAATDPGGSGTGDPGAEPVTEEPVTEAELIESANKLEEELIKGGGLLNKLVKKKCQCTCQGQILDAMGVHDGSADDLWVTEERKAEEKCHDQCARSCGGLSDCIKKSVGECRSCCSAYCKTEYKGAADAGPEALQKCVDACAGNCEFKGIVTKLVDAFYYIAGILGALMISVQGVRLITSQDTSARKAAKAGILHVLFALFIVMMAGVIVNYFLGEMSGIPEIGGKSGEGSMQDPTKGSGTGAKDSREIDFEADKTSGLAPLTVKFTASARGETPVKYEWDLGGISSIAKNPVVEYTRAGKKTVKLTVTYEDGETLVKEIANYITVRIDTDGDGVTDDEEELHGTDPNDATDYPAGSVYGKAILGGKLQGDNDHSGIMISVEGAKTVTGRDGSFRIDDLNPRIYSVKASKSGWIEAVTSKMVTSGGETETVLFLCKRGGSNKDNVCGASESSSWELLYDRNVYTICTPEVPMQSKIKEWLRDESWNALSRGYYDNAVDDIRKGIYDFFHTGTRKHAEEGVMQTNTRYCLTDCGANVKASDILSGARECGDCVEWSNTIFSTLRTAGVPSDRVMILIYKTISDYQHAIVLYKGDEPRDRWYVINYGIKYRIDEYRNKNPGEAYKCIYSSSNDLGMREYEESMFDGAFTQIGIDKCERA